MRESDAIRKMEMPKIERDSCFIVAQYELERETEGLETRRENSSKIFAFKGREFSRKTWQLLTCGC